ncbi:hypothetical protein [Litoribrevibacter albus]|uniref:Uncharacterized protein n=1 Tax=Litoribrevibacter albus TaxID=1473156 RepID=A0AA37SA58_9GAMM|nr:hypothetical protein [Litoribrevibacter albus]GLQ31329.1 hypothetical protein GCM10007876_18080 [Litoribrevibacter albus]
MIVPHPGYELTSQCISEIKAHIAETGQRKPILFFPHSKYSIGFCAMKELIRIQQHLQVGIVSGSERTRMVFDFLTDLCKGVEILPDTKAMIHWLQRTQSMRLSS